MEENKKLGWGGSWGQSPLVLALAAVNLAAFLLAGFVPGLGRHLLLPLVLRELLGRPWTLLATPFTHEMLLQLAVNMILFLLFGRELEKMLGAGRILRLYALGAAAGIVVMLAAGLYLGWDTAAGAGPASSWAVISAYAAIRPEDRFLQSTTRQWVLVMTMAVVLLSIAAPGVTIPAAGQIAGMLAGAWLGRRMRAVAGETGGA